VLFLLDKYWKHLGINWKKVWSSIIQSNECNVFNWFSIYRFDYCEKCHQLFDFNDIVCPICSTKRFTDDNKLKSFFFMKDLKEIQQNLYKGLTDNMKWFFQIQLLLVVCLQQFQNYKKEIQPNWKIFMMVQFINNIYDRVDWVNYIKRLTLWQLMEFSTKFTLQFNFVDDQRKGKIVLFGLYFWWIMNSNQVFKNLMTTR